MTNPPIDLSEFQYHLPEDKIAKFPLPQRDESKLLHYQAGKITDYHFNQIADLLPEDSTLVFNNTKVIPARLIFHKATGAKIEIFLLKPLHPTPIVAEAMLCGSGVIWECMIGNAKRWKNDTVLTLEINTSVGVVLLEAVRTGDASVRFTWSSSELRFVDIVEASGKVPLPPYLQRQAIDEDKPRYQTVYSKNEGAVAAPTAGLHFTDTLLEKLTEKNIHQEYLTLHVSAGTFQPIKVTDVTQHPMHKEQIIITQPNIESLLTAKKIVAVGTTSMRTLESLYWFGVKLIQNPDSQFFIEKLFPYEIKKDLPSRTEALATVLTWMKRNKQSSISGETEIFIFPGYEFMICEGLITNFHQPASTLMLLIASFVGDDWKQIYQHALESNYRFLSYGDSSLLWRK